MSLTTKRKRFDLTIYSRWSWPQEAHQVRRHTAQCSSSSGSFGAWLCISFSTSVLPPTVKAHLLLKHCLVICWCIRSAWLVAGDNPPTNANTAGWLSRKWDWNCDFNGIHLVKTLVKLLLISSQKMSCAPLPQQHSELRYWNHLSLPLLYKALISAVNRVRADASWCYWTQVII